MEIFIDGGLFEFLIAVSLGYAINFIYSKKYLLILFSAISLVAPVLVFFLKKSDAFYFLASVGIINAVLLVLLLWRERQRFPNEPLFDIREFKERVWKNSSWKPKSLKKT